MSNVTAERVYPEGLDYFPIAVFQLQALKLIEEGCNWTELARRCGMRKVNRTRDHSRLEITGDSGYLKMVLGLRINKAGRRPQSRSVKRTVSYDLAVRLCRGLGVDYHDIGV